MPGRADRSATKMVSTTKHTSTQPFTALCRGLPGSAGTRRNLHPLTPIRKKKEDLPDNKVYCVGALPLHSALNQRMLLDAIKPAYNQSRPDGRLKLTVSAFNQLWISMLAVLVAVPTVMQNSLHPLSTSSITAQHLLEFMVQGKIIDADALIIHLDITPSRLLVPPPPSSPIFMLNALSAATLLIYHGLHSH